MAATATRPLLDYLDVERIVCLQCGRDVLSAGSLQLEPGEIIYPPMDCVHCFGKPWTADGWCRYCEGRGKVGEGSPAHAVAVNDVGHARAWTPGSPRDPGEALYRRHVCQDPYM